jgi:hypothetical protein
VLSDYWVPVVAGVVGLVVLLAVLAIWWRRRRSGWRGALSAVAVDELHEILVPDGMGGEIHVEYLLLTAHGLVVVDVKRFEGVIFAGERMDEWTVIGKQGRHAFPNPLGTLYDRVAAVKRLVREVPVTGHVLFVDGADFSKGRPPEVLLPDELAERYAKPEKPEIERTKKAFAAHWDALRSAVSPARAPAS